MWPVSAERFVAVYCGSSSGHDPSHAELAVALGSGLAGAGLGVVYGGGHVGLMGVVADAALAAGGDVVGVMTRALVESEVAHSGLTRLDITETMHERKARMTELSTGVIVLPGGFGTLDECFEVLTWNQLGLTARAVVFLDSDGYFDPLVDFISGAVEAGFIRPEHGALAQRAAGVGRAIELAAGEPAAFTPKWQ